MSKIIAVVGLPGAGKSVVTDYLVKQGYQKLYFGQITFDELGRRGLAVNEKNERMIREGFRKKYGMAAYAILNLPKLKKLIQNGDVVIESLYSWDEYLIVKKEFKKDLIVMAVYAPPELRYQRLKDRPARSLTFKEAEIRDHAHVEKLAAGGPIAMAGYTIINDGTLQELHKKIDEILKII